MCYFFFVSGLEKFGGHQRADDSSQFSALEIARLISNESRFTSSSQLFKRYHRLILNSNLQLRTETAQQTEILV